MSRRHRLGYIAQLHRDTGASLIAYGHTRAEAQRRLIAALESTQRRVYAAEQAATAITQLSPED